MLWSRASCHGITMESRSSREERFNDGLERLAHGVYAAGGIDDAYSLPTGARPAEIGFAHPLEIGALLPLEAVSGTALLRAASADPGIDVEQDGEIGLEPRVRPCLQCSDLFPRDTAAAGLVCIARIG